MAADTRCTTELEGRNENENEKDEARFINRALAPRGDPMAEAGQSSEGKLSQLRTESLLASDGLSRRSWYDRFLLYLLE